MPTGHRTPARPRRRGLLLALATAGLGFALAAPDAHAQKAPEETLKLLQVPKGLEIGLWAAEPIFSNPTNIDIDERGRVWVCEGVNYRKWANPPLRPEGDRIVCLEDTDGDGKADKSTVFYQGMDVNAALGICVLGNKVIVSCAPNVFLLTDTDGDGKADKKEVIFTGIGGVQHDHSVHAFVFGPDGKLYFNFGNEGRQLKRPDGKEVVDTDGNIVAAGRRAPKAAGAPKPASDNRGPYREGMVFRCDPDFSNVETLAWNFRNNYEVAADSFGTLWQSDNDDDGNRGVRINFVMDRGNYGYVDEMTGAGWSAKRTNLEPETPARHWHLNDPGVVPNWVQTGGGSPTGIIAYEGDALPAAFRNQVIHCEPGQNVVRMYPRANEGAGYTTEFADNPDFKVEAFPLIGRPNKMVDLVRCSDKWFRPSDVCVGTDGAIYIADWYDPGVGGHAMGDNKPGQTKGRIYRIAPAGAKVAAPKFDVSTAAGAVVALQSPNLSARYQGWTALHKAGAAAEPELLKLWTGNLPHLRARALHLLARIDGKAQQYVGQAIKDPNADIRITGLRIARDTKLDMIQIVKSLASDPSPQVRRECVLALRRSASPEMPALWAELAAQHDGKDRWYLEALGIGAAGRDAECLTAFLSKVGGNWNTPAGRDVVWRTRAPAAATYLTKVILDAQTPEKEVGRYFRAFDFLPKDAPEVNEALTGILAVESASKGVTAETVSALARRGVAPSTPQLKGAIDKALSGVAGTADFVDLVEQFGLKDRNLQLLDIAVANAGSQLGGDALKVILKFGDAALIEKAIANTAANPAAGTDPAAAAAKIVSALGATTDKNAQTLLLRTVTSDKLGASVRAAAVQALARQQSGANALLKLVQQKKLADDVLGVAGQALHGASWTEVRTEAKKLLPLPEGANKAPLPPIAKLLEMKGNVANGAKVFENQCAKCHIVNGKGTDLGPDQSEVGAKYGKDAMYQQILFPSLGIAFGYENHLVTLKNREEGDGVKVSETEEELVLKNAGNIVTRYKKANIVERRISKTSIMPEQLQQGMTTQELVDLVEYLATLKKAQKPTQPK